MLRRIRSSGAALLRNATRDFLRRWRVEVVLVVLASLSFGSEISARFSVMRRPGSVFSCERAGWIVGDCRSYRAIVKGLVDEHTLDQSVVAWDRDIYVEGLGQTVLIQHSNVSLTVDGKLVPKHPVLFAFALTPAYAILREYGLLAFNVVACVSLVLVVYRLARLFFGELGAATAAVGFLTDGVVRHYSYNVSPDVFGALLLLGGTVAVWTKGGSRTRLFTGGALLGLALWMRPSNLVGLSALLPALVASLQARKPTRDLVWPGLGFALLAGGLLALDATWFGGPFVTSYDRTVIMTAGARSFASHRDHMTRPLLASLASTFFDHEHGFLQTAPHWPLLLGAAPWLFRRDRARTLALVILTLAPVLAMARYEFWDASSYGNRFFIFSAAVSSIGIAWLVEALGRGSDSDSTWSDADERARTKTT